MDEMNDSKRRSGSDDGAPRRRSRRAIALFVLVTLAFAAAVGVSRYLEIAALRAVEAP